MQINFHDRTILITGGSAGIGQATVNLFLEGGARVINLDLAPPGESIKPSVKYEFKACDLSDFGSVKQIFEALANTCNKIDVLVNNAGIQSRTRLEETSETEWNRVMDTNLKAYFACAKFALPLLLKAKNPVIVNVASVKTQVCQHDELSYITSKAAILGFTRSIATDYAPRLRCLAVSPGAVDTPLLRNDLDSLPNKEEIYRQTENVHLLQRIARPEEVANLIYFLASDKASFITGHEYRVDGGIGIKIEGI